MNGRKFEQKWVYLGLLYGALYFFDLVVVPDISLTVLSIFFGGLLAIASLIPSTKDYESMKFISKSGHINDLLKYIRLPLFTSFILILIEFLYLSLVIELSYLIDIYSIVSLSLWGLFLCSIFRLLVLVPKIVKDGHKEK